MNFIFDLKIEKSIFVILNSFEKIIRCGINVKTKAKIIPSGPIKWKNDIPITIVNDF